MSGTGGRIMLAEGEQVPHAQLPAAVLRDTEVSVGARMMYAILVWIGWRQNWRAAAGYQGQAAVAEEFGISRRSVVTYLRELEERGWIESTRVGLGQPDDIRVFAPWELDLDAMGINLD